MFKSRDNFDDANQIQHEFFFFSTLLGLGSSLSFYNVYNDLYIC